jgi:phosphatidate cytidylyltransferase
MPVYPVAPFILLILLNQNPLYRPLVYILFILVSTFDTGSYIAGKAYGTHPIAPHISPGKTWQGLIGGYVITTVVLYALCSILHAPPTSWFNIIFISLLLCLFSFAGDLFESFLKRRAGIKDSGNILPGHGGFLDRFDSLLCAVIFFYVARNYLLTFFNV